jgi:hypothetical protein
MAEINEKTANALKTGGDLASNAGPWGALADVIVGTTVGIFTSKQQAKLQERLGILTLEEQAKLNAQLLKTQDKNAKLALIENAIKEKEKTKRLPLYIGIGVFVLVLGVATFVLIRRKKA